MCSGNTKETYVEILCFRQFYKYFVFVEDGGGNWNKRMERLKAKVQEEKWMDIRRQSI